MFFGKLLMRWLIVTLGIGLGACTPGSLTGSYESRRATIGVATLELTDQHKFKFCFRGECSEGDFEVIWRNAPNETQGRLKFDDAFIEEFYKQNAEATYLSMPEYTQVRRGFQEADYWLYPTRISIDGGSDAMFVRR